MRTTPDPDCRSCHGEGGYYEDVAGDGGSRMLVACDCCQSPDACEYIIRWDDHKPETCGKTADYFRKSALGYRVRLCRDHALHVPCDQLEAIGAPAVPA